MFPHPGFQWKVEVHEAFCWFVDDGKGCKVIPISKPMLWQIQTGPLDWWFSSHYKMLKGICCPSKWNSGIGIFLQVMPWQSKKWCLWEVQGQTSRVVQHILPQKCLICLSDNRITSTRNGYQASKIPKVPSISNENSSFSQVISLQHH